ncbi:hypothetical protein HD842_000781 [Massilia aurea]|uniref:Uncharacterized protein n=1 Tax=Massilia aurea TaxID=373040 RepID=A0A7W9U7X3_9BURK|nr:hypothetical protein [Massilia aurea]MBB6132670.1 hypothetical protein [Massilia aurea]
MNPIPRLDRITAAHVNLAIHVAAAFSLSDGVKLLHDTGIAPALIQRVLIDGGPRRSATAARPELFSHASHLGAETQ